MKVAMKKGAVSLGIGDYKRWGHPKVTPALISNFARRALLTPLVSSYSLTVQSHTFQKMVGAIGPGSTPTMRSLTPVTPGNWKIVAP